MLICYNKKLHYPLISMNASDEHLLIPRFIYRDKRILSLRITKARMTFFTKVTIPNFVISRNFMAGLAGYHVIRFVRRRRRS